MLPECFGVDRPLVLRQVFHDQQIGLGDEVVYEQRVEVAIRVQSDPVLFVRVVPRSDVLVRPARPARQKGRI